MGVVVIEFSHENDYYKTTTSLTSSTTSTSLTTTTISPNVTLFIENTIIVQPFLDDHCSESDFEEPPTCLMASWPRRKWGWRFLTKEVQPHVPMAIMVIDSSKVVLHVLSSIRGRKRDFQQYQVVAFQSCWWVSCDLRLTPLFQYEVDIVAGSLVLNHLVINTTDDDKSRLLTSRDKQIRRYVADLAWVGKWTKQNPLKRQFKSIRKTKTKRSLRWETYWVAQNKNLKEPSGQW